MLFFALSRDFLSQVTGNLKWIIGWIILLHVGINFLISSFWSFLKVNSVNIMCVNILTYKFQNAEISSFWWVFIFFTHLKNVLIQENAVLDADQYLQRFVFVYLPHDYNNYKEMPKKM